MSQTVQHELIQLTRRLKDCGIDSATTDARLLMAHALGIEKSRLTLHANDDLNEEQLDLLTQAALKRANRTPMSHILGFRGFYGRRFKVNDTVLDPRPETETLVSEALSRPFSTVLDLGTGTGAIALTLLAERPRATGVATDLSQGALAVARENAVALGVADRIAFEPSNWFAAVQGRFDVIVSNPPYIALEEMSSLAPELAFEPRMALTDEADGLTAYRVITQEAPEHLTPNGWLIVEIGWQQGADVAALFEQAGLQNVAIRPDLDGRDRVVIGQKA